MPDTLHLEIAGIAITVAAAEADQIFEQDPAKQRFIRSAGPGEAAIHVTLLNDPGAAPDTRRMTKLFDAGPTWQMHHGENGYCLTVKPHRHRPALWTLTAGPDFSRVTAYCGPNLVDTKNGINRLPNPMTYPLDQILLMHYLASRQGILLHAAGVLANRRAFIFAGRSGAGKTSLARRLQSRDPLRFLSDDRILVRKAGDRFTAFGTPWPGEGGIAENDGGPLEGLFFIIHGQSTRVTPIRPQTALKRLLPVASVPWYDREAFPGALDCCEAMTCRVPAYDFHITPEIEVMDVLEDFF